MLSVTLLIIALNVGISAAAWYGIFDLGKLTLRPASVVGKGEWYRLVTSGFVHADWSHLLFNMFTLFFFGSSVEVYYHELFGSSGKFWFVGLYLTGLVLSDIYDVYKYRNESRYQSLGASGAVSAVLFASILLSPTDPIYIFIIPIGIPGFIYGFLYLIYCQYLHKRGGDNINHLAHFWGSVVGVIYTAAIDPQSVPYFMKQLSDWLHI